MVLRRKSLSAFFVQRERWARGATQILFLPEGPLGPRLSLMHRLLLFLPTHWLSQSFMMLMTIVAPIVFLWTGLTPLVNVDTPGVLSYIVPMVLAVIGGMVVFAPGKYFPLAAQVLGTFQSFKILPTVLATFIKPFGHVFQVTPKGGDPRQGELSKRNILDSCGHDRADDRRSPIIQPGVSSRRRRLRFYRWSLSGAG